MNQYRKNLLEQLRLCVVKKDAAPLSDDRIAKAVTVNEELGQYGYGFSAAGLIELAKAGNLDTFLEEFAALMPDVKAKPMYPDYPRQVMTMDEAEFRFHQMAHYMSTYGMEELARIFGQEYEVKRGWLPEVKETAKTKTDGRLLDVRYLELLDEGKEYVIPLQRLLQKPERLTAQEIEIVKEALPHVKDEDLDFRIPFKRNQMEVFYVIFDSNDRKAALARLHKLCQHTGDVLKCTDYCLTKRKYRFHTAEKRLLVHLIESYPQEDWKANVILSGKKARRTVEVLQYLSYNRFSQSPDHREVVRQLRNGELTSWEGTAKQLLKEKNEAVLDFIAKRPGMLLRWTNWLIGLGYDKERIAEILTENAGSLSAKTLCFALTLLGRKENREDAYGVLYRALTAKLAAEDTPLKGRRVFVDPGRLDLAHSMMLSKGDEAGYVRNGLAYRIPAEVNRIRFFVYWNDPKRVDVDLHCAAYGQNGEKYEIGWDEGFRDFFAVHSGDVTHSDAAEYIDIDMNSPLEDVQLNLNLFDGKSNFREIAECYTGMMAVREIGEDVRLYDPANCFFHGDIRSRTRTLHYGYVNVPGRYLCLDDTAAKVQWVDGAYTSENHKTSAFTLDVYLRLLLECQNAVWAASEEDAEITLVMEKAEKESQISLIDEEFFLGEQKSTER